MRKLASYDRPSSEMGCAGHLAYNNNNGYGLFVTPLWSSSLPRLSTLFSLPRELFSLIAAPNRLSPSPAPNALNLAYGPSSFPHCTSSSAAVLTRLVRPHACDCLAPVYSCQDKRQNARGRWEFLHGRRLPRQPSSRGSDQRGDSAAAGRRFAARQSGGTDRGRKAAAADRRASGRAHRTHRLSALVCASEGVCVCVRGCVCV